MTLKVSAKAGAATGELVLGNFSARCALGPAGMVADKREGDGGTPIAKMPLLTVYYRPDRLARPMTALKTVGILPDMGWCDDPASPAYNRMISLPFDGSHERMWRDDHAYDICVVLDWNFQNPVPGRGSAIFFHLARDGYPPTEGCIAVSLDDMKDILKRCEPDSVMETALVE